MPRNGPRATAPRATAPSAVPHLLHLRSRALPSTLASLAGGAVAVSGCLEWLTSQQDDDASTRTVLTVVAAVLMAAAVGVGLHSHSPDADRTASRRWWPLRTGHVLALSAVASALLYLAVTGPVPAFGAAAVVRNVLGAIGVTALAVTVIGARLSWLPMFSYGGVALLLGPREPEGASAVWLWIMQPGTQTAAWSTAVAAFAVGVTVYALRGPRPSDDRR